MPLSNRKETRLTGYDYSTPGAYFVTICTKDREARLSIIRVGTDVLGGPQYELTECGRIVDKHLHNMSTFYANVKVDTYVIMPNHVHLLIRIIDGEDDGPPRTSVPTIRPLVGKSAVAQSILSQFVSTFKRFCNREVGENIWQMRSYDHIIRGEQDYREIWQYINENPIKWQLDEFYSVGE